MLDTGRMPLRKVIDSIRQSLWFVPAVWVVASTVAALGIVALDHATPELPSQVPLIFSGGAEGARGLLSAVASSTITVVGVVFSITMVALQLASSQYSPRVLRNFMRDRASQMTLGAFIGAFTYSVLVLRSVRGGADGTTQFVPVLAVTGAVVLALVAVGMLVYFMHHIAQRMQVSSITASVADETLREIDRQASTQDGAKDAPSVRPPQGPATQLAADQSGYLQYVETDRLVRIAAENDVVVRLLHRPGAWIQEHAPLFEIWGTHAIDVVDAIRRHVSVGTERVVYQDPDFGVQQLVDIAVKAVSPGINDPTTARNALHRLVQVLTAASRQELAAEEHYGPDGALRLLVARATFVDLLRTAFEEIHHFGGDIPSVARSLRDSFATLEASVSPAHRGAVADAGERYGGS